MDFDYTGFCASSEPIRAWSGQITATHTGILKPAFLLLPGHRTSMRAYIMNRSGRAVSTQSQRMYLGSGGRGRLTFCRSRLMRSGSVTRDVSSFARCLTFRPQSLEFLSLYWNLCRRSTTEMFELSSSTTCKADAWLAKTYCRGEGGRGGVEFQLIHHLQSRCLGCKIQIRGGGGSVYPCRWKRIVVYLSTAIKVWRYKSILAMESLMLCLAWGVLAYTLF